MLKVFDGCIEDESLLQKKNEEGLRRATVIDKDRETRQRETEITNAKTKTKTRTNATERHKTLQR